MTGLNKTNSLVKEIDENQKYKLKQLKKKVSTYLYITISKEYYGSAATVIRILIILTV